MDYGFYVFNLGCDAVVPVHQCGISSTLNKTGCL